MCLAIQTRSEEKGAFLKRRLGFRNAWFFIKFAIFWKIEQDDSFWKKARLLTWQNATTSTQKLTRKGAFFISKFHCFQIIIDIKTQNHIPLSILKYRKAIFEMKKAPYISLKHSYGLYIISRTERRLFGLVSGRLW